ncbi:GNAT family N-acetyltransferase [Palleronia pelagia]|uniref:Acetyltransferase (GNAT) family protein n=1 Tax=Palleronia pelagia TaxID=387096 RepID=A0A1H8FDC0_9RHOB|nr:GNAT family N-acetyltransferase [Palleronia pelagia]SEN29606.1 Acetyltransferase (GNAT) family protein [Palleronia pelagia]
MQGYFGSAQVQALQRARDADVAELWDRPGAVVHARAFSSDDPEALGWDRLRDVMAREGIVTLRGVGPEVVEQATRELAEFSPNLHHWDIFRADTDTLRAVCGPLAAAPLPGTLTRLPVDALTDDVVHAVQAFLDGHGVSPFSRDALTGRLFPARLVVITHRDGMIAAAGFAAMTHNRFSPFHRDAWVGLIAVDPDLRGLGLGRQVDAITNLEAVDALGADGSIEFVARDNAPSRAMLESCGLRQMPDRAVVMFSTSTDRLSR